MLTPTAQRILDTLPDYYWGNAIVERVVQSWANEIDRIDAWLDKLKAGMNPGTATDEMGLLTIWEQTLDLPVAAAGATLEQRQAATSAAIRRLDVTTAEDVVDLLIAAIGPGFGIQRNTPGQLQDTISIPFAENTYGAARVEEIARAAWPSHRRVFIHYSTGFILEVSRLDADTL